MIDAQFRFNQCNSFREEYISVFSPYSPVQNASSLKPLGQLKPNCPGMIIGRSSTKFLFVMPIGNPRWLPLKSLYRSPGYKKKPIGPM
jgi:hypothetical protein